MSLSNTFFKILSFKAYFCTKERSYFGSVVSNVKPRHQQMKQQSVLNCYEDNKNKELNCY